MKKSDARYLKLLADNLPEIPDPSKQVMESRILVTGSQLLKQGTKTVKGDPVKPNDLFTRLEKPKPALVNHYNKLKDAFIRGGLPLVEKYCNGVMEKANLKTVSVEETATL